ncbi:EthD family reductase [Poseidonibacter lekithochrous]|uniref:EthD family reductase n=1 Tax=Poseidonibacter TaxID=2321187 RepID=UPI001C08F546|nr:MULTISPECIES: EthD family reductase [Poseidonibacter]MBU3015075.1 EthD family reductase [Poseidonibacter lekithochrous]MDO6828371.1 EthD family reductase [Poseidonibacter sp. 1_MG-2023]
MIKVSVLYPNSEYVVFDKEYYLDKHVPLVTKLLGDALKNAQVDFGLAGGLPGSPALYVVMTHMTFDSVEAFEAIFGVHSEELLSDIPNFTNSQPQIQISEVLI